MHLHHAGCDHHDQRSPRRLNRAFAIAVILNVLLVIGEAVGGLLSGSMALLADAGHNLGDVAGLILAWWAHWLQGRGRSGRWTYGWRSFTIVAANLNGLLLVFAIVGVSVESIRRLFVPSDIAEIPVVVVALVATVLNFATARLLASDGQDLNVRGAYLHMLADAAVSLAVVLGAVLMMATGWMWVDAVISLSICVVLAIGTWGLLRESTSMLMHAAPLQLDVEQVRSSIQSETAVAGVVDLHIWSVSTTDVLLTARLLCPQLTAEQQDELLDRLHSSLQQEFAISHATLEIIRGTELQRECPLDDKMRNILT